MSVLGIGRCIPEALDPRSQTQGRDLPLNAPGLMPAVSAHLRPGLRKVEMWREKRKTRQERRGKGGGGGRGGGGIGPAPEQKETGKRVVSVET